MEKTSLQRAIDGLGRLWTRPAQLPNVISIGGNGSRQKILRNQDYFAVHVRELFIANTGRLWAEYEPMVFAATEYIYDNVKIVVPFVVGPSLINQPKGKIPEGLLIHDTQVAGWAPFRGGKVSLTMILYRVKRTDHAQKLLSVIEGVSGAVDFGVAVAGFTKIAAPILDGMNGLLDLGDAEAVLGQRIEFDSEADEGFPTGDVALVASDDYPRDGHEFGIAEKRLTYGAKGRSFAPFRECDFLLYNISSSKERHDDAKLPFAAIKRDAMDAALRGEPEDWERARAQLLTLYRTMALSPDLVQHHVDSLFGSYQAEALRHKANAERLKTLSKESPSSTQRTVRAESSDKLKAITRQVLNLGES